MRKTAFVLALLLAAGLPVMTWAQAAPQGGTQGGAQGGAQTQADDAYGRWRDSGDRWGPGGGMMGPGGGMMGGGMMGGMMGGAMMDMMGHGDMMGGGMMGGGLMMGFGPDLFDRAQQMLTLTDDQVTRLRTLWLDFVRASATPRANLQVARAELQNLMSARTVNLPQVEARVRDVARLRGDLDLAEARFAVQAKGVLTPEQLQRLRTFGGAGTGQAPGTRGGMMGPGGRMGN